jgi:serine/threonine protein kinase
MEYCKEGDLSQYTLNDHSATTEVSEQQFWEIFHQLASAVLYCHTGLRIDDGKITVDVGWKKPVLHRDIKPANGM